MDELFSTLPPRDRHRVAQLLAGCPRIALRAGEACAAGDVSGATLLIVENGLVVVLSCPRANRRMVLALSAGGMVLPPPSGDEQLVALADSTLIAVAADVQRAMLELPATAEAVVAALLEALRERQESLAQFANVAHAERLREKLLQLARIHGKVVAGGVRIELPLTHELLGQAVGSARETVTSALRALEHEGFLVREGRSYRLTVSPELLGSM